MKGANQNKSRKTKRMYGMNFRKERVEKGGRSQPNRSNSFKKLNRLE